METYTLRSRADRPAVRYKIDYAGELNQAQHEAATTLEGPVLVIAGAGSGKTRTLVYRVARLVESGVNPAQILLLTFTRKAAEEMLRRAAVLVGSSCEHVSGGTFHSFANVVLRRTGRSVGLSPGFTILDRGDSEDVVNLRRRAPTVARHGGDANCDIAGRKRDPQREPAPRKRARRELPPVRKHDHTRRAQRRAARHETVGDLARGRLRDRRRCQRWSDDHGATVALPR